MYASLQECRCRSTHVMTGRRSSSTDKVLIRLFWYKPNSATVGGVSTSIITSQFNQGPYSLSTDLVTAISPNTPPDTAVLMWPQTTRVDRVVVWGLYLIDFDVQTTVDGTTWVTQATVTKTSNTSFQHGTGADNAGCERETYWDEQWIFDVPFPNGPMTCKGVRLYVRATAYGSEPDSLMRGRKRQSFDAAAYCQ